MLRNKIVILLLILSCGSVTAQAFREGVIVMNESGDTIQGYLQQEGPWLFFKETLQTDRRMIKSHDLTYYRFGEEQHVCGPVEVMKGHFPENEYLCLEVIEDGELKLLVGDAADVYGNLWENYYLQPTGETPIRVWKGKRFRKQMSWFFEANETLLEKIKSKELKYEDLAVITQEHNRWITSQQ